MKCFVCICAAAVLLLGEAGRARAGQILYGTANNTNPGQILRIDTGTNSVTSVFTPVGQPDSLVFDSNGNFVYTNLTAGQVRSYNPTTHTDTLLASGISDPADLALTPDKTSVLVSDFTGGKIYKVNLSTHALTQFGPTYGGNPQGLAFDNNGNLFAVLGTRNNSASSFIAQLDTTTGAIIHQSANLVQLDGLTFDPFSGKLYSGSLAGNGLYQFDPTTLSNTQLANTSGRGYDGLTTDSAGNLYLVDRSNEFVDQYNLTNNQLTQLTSVAGLDDLAPASGLGAPAVPEPASVVLLLTGAAGAVGYTWRRRLRVA
jgi:DNA-binding beta-propeller fold protein YncE